MCSHDSVSPIGRRLSQQEQAQAETSGQGQGNQDLAKKSQNPISDLISLPFQNNLRTQSVGTGGEDT